MRHDYYMILGLDPGATSLDIKRAYRALAMKYHPDMNQGDQWAEEKFKLISEAYDVLKDQEKRSAYDRDRLRERPVRNKKKSRRETGEFLYGDELLQDFYRGFYSRHEPRKEKGRPGRDIRQNLKISFREAALGTEATIYVPALMQCPQCRGTGMKAGARTMPCRECRRRGMVKDARGFYKKCPVCDGAGTVVTAHCGTCKGTGRVWARRALAIHVPAGIETGTRLRVQGMGMQGKDGGKSGDFFVVVQVERHPFFEREGLDLHCTVPVPFPNARKGLTIAVPTLDGVTKIKIPAGTKTGRIIRLKGKGIALEDTQEAGDIVFRIMVEEQPKISPKKKEAARKGVPKYPLSERFKKRLDKYLHEDA